MLIIPVSMIVYSPLRFVLALMFLLLMQLGSWVYAQPRHDACSLARRIQPGDFLVGEDNRLASIEEATLPETEPITCIKTYENDLWYTFDTQGAYQYYSLRVEPLSCESPAGLQLILIKADTCDPAKYDYTACLNPYATEPLELIWENPVPGETYLIQVDGYDGNICAFNLHLEGFADDPRDEEDLRRMRYDPRHPDPSFDEAELQTVFLNNAVTLDWQASTREDIKFFLVEQVRSNPFDSTLSGHVVGLVEPKNLVGDGLMANYQFTLDKVFLDGQRYCFQVVKIQNDLSRDYSEPSCVEANLIEDFFISEVYLFKPEESDRLYAIKYINRKRQDLVFGVYNAAGRYLKGYTRKREPLTDGVITIDMAAYDPGVYELRVEGRRGTFKRSFVIN